MSDEIQEQAAAPKDPPEAKGSEAMVAMGEASPEVPAGAVPASSETKAASEEPAAVEPARTTPRRRSLPPYIAQAAMLAVAVGLGWLGGSGGFAARKAEPNPAHEALLQIDWTGLAANVEKGQADTGRLAAEMQALKAGLASLKEGADRSKQELGARLAGLTERLDKSQRTEQEVAAKVAAVAERLDRPERDAAVRLIPAIEAKLAPMAERLDRIERQGLAIANTVASGAGTKQAAAAPEPTQTASIQDKSKPPVLEGWVIRDIDKGYALLEGRNQRLVEVVPGQNLPGAGRIEAIERRGKTWVVVTAKGIITSQQW